MSPETPSRKFSRREFLMVSGVTAAGALLAACTPASTTESPTTAPDGGESPTTSAPVAGVSNVVFMHKRSEFAEADELAFEEENADISVEFVEWDLQKF